MSKLSPTLKSLIAAPFAKPNTLPATPKVRSVYEQLRQEASSKNVGTPAWLTLSTATTMTMNSPESLTELYKLATEGSKDKIESVQTAELMREVGLKCIGFNGIPRTINCLGAFRSSLPSDIISLLSNKPTRNLSTQNIGSRIHQGQDLWTSIYRPFDSKLYDKLGESHPDLPVWILNNGYGALFSDPSNLPVGAKVGRVLTSIVAVSCLRAQTGVGPQVTSHVFGLRKAFEDGSAESEEKIEGGEWLAGEAGNEWLLNAIDRVVDALGEGKGSSFAPGMERIKAKL